MCYSRFIELIAIIKILLRIKTFIISVLYYYLE